MSWESFAEMTDTRSASYGVGAVIGAGWRAIDAADQYLFEEDGYETQWLTDTGGGGAAGLTSYMAELGLAGDTNYSDDIWLGAGFASGAAAVDGLIYAVQESEEGLENMYDDVVDGT